MPRLPFCGTDSGMRATRVASTALGVAFLLCLSTGCGSEGPGPTRPVAPPDIVLIVVDTLRADHLGAYGYARGTSPVLDAIARKATLFTNATSTSSWTRPSMASLFTARLPSELGLHTTTDVLEPTWPERLATTCGLYFLATQTGDGWLDEMTVLGTPPCACFGNHNAMTGKR